MRVSASLGICLAITFAALTTDAGYGQSQSTVSVEQHPAPNAAGWHNMPVTLTYVCAGEPVCPPPVTIDNDGAAQRVTRQIDIDGKTVDVTAVVEIDTRPSNIFISSPGPDAEIVALAASVRATATDDLSGVAVARCNGRDATLNGKTISCDVVLHEGFNDIIVTAVDRAGNSASTARRVFRPSPSGDLLAIPGTMTMTPGDRRPAATGRSRGTNPRECHSLE